MGKIFEALEKSRKEQNGEAPTLKEEKLVAAGEVFDSKDREAPIIISSKKLRSEKGLNSVERFNSPLTPDKGSNAMPPDKKREEKRSKAVKNSRRHENKNGNLVCLLAPHSVEAERFKLLKSQILYLASGVIPSPIAVTSALPGEGKSFIAANLAISIAQDIDRHVLLIDSDLRRPCIHSLFGFEDVPGLSEYFTEGKDLSELLLRTKQDKLKILPAGASAPNPSELLSSKRMSALLTEVSQRYQDRVVILDTTPLAITAEGNILVQFVDSILLVVKQNRTPKKQLKELVKRIGAEKIIGTVLNHVDRYSESYSEYRKYEKRYYHWK